MLVLLSNIKAHIYSTDLKHTVVVMILNTILSRDLLVDAYKFYCRGDARAHDALKIIINRNDMNNAVEECLNEALKSEEPDKQQLYIQAACFGKKFHPGIAIDEFQNACRKIRVLNTCRYYGIDVSHTDSIDSIVDRFIARKQFSLALWIINWLKTSGQERVLNCWATYMIEKRHLRDEVVALKIQEKLGRDPIVPYADIASKAIEYNRATLAIKLIEREGQSSKQIPLLLSLRQYDMVLVQALATYDSNMIYMAIFKLKESIASEVQFLELIKKHPMAFKYYCNYLAISDIQKLILISYANSSQEELALYLMDNKLDSALAVSRRTKQEFTTNQIEARIRLVKFQQSLSKLGKPPKTSAASWNELSVSETITNLIALGHVAKAKDCQRRFEVPDRKYKALEQIALDNLPPLTVPTNT